MRTIFILIGCLTAAAAAGTDTLHGADPVTLVRDGRAVLPIVAGSVEAPVKELQADLKRISGAELNVVEARRGARGVYVGLVGDFPWVTRDGRQDIGPEGFVIRSRDGNLYLLAEEPSGVQHAVTTFLRMLGCRQFFPGKVWEVVPSHETIEGTWDERQSPDYRSQRRLWYGYGAYAPAKRDLDEWDRRNRMGGPEPVSIGHTGYGLDFEKEFEEHPEWFALVERDGRIERRNSKPCYSHPEVIERIKQHALRQAAEGRRSVSLSPPDGLGYCECDRCRQVFQGGEPFRSHSTLFAQRPDGVTVNITSETLFHAVNEAAQAVAEKHPDVRIGCYAYSAYSHPPSFALVPNVFVQTTTAFRRTPLGLHEQLEQWGQRARQVGIREYWSVYQWDWDNPDPGKMRPAKLQEDLRFFHDQNVIAMNAESCNNWGPRGLGYYVAAQLLWDLDADVEALVRDFYHTAFGPAAGAMERYYARWYGPSVVVGLDPQSARIAAVRSDDDAARDDDELTGSGPVFGSSDSEAARRTLAAAFADLDEAARLTQDDPEHRARVDHLRMYAYYLYLRLKVWEASAAEDDAATVAAVRDETLFGGRLTETNMIHSRPLIGKAFHRRFRDQMDLLEDVPVAQEWGQGWRVIGKPPSQQELKDLWSQALQGLDL